MLYRIFTENKNQEGIEEIVNKYYPGYTIIKSEGYSRLQKENSLIIEIVTEDDNAKIDKIAKDLKEANKQESVLVQVIENHQYFI